MSSALNPLVVCTDDQLALLLEATLPLRILTSRRHDLPAGVATPSCLFLGEYAREDLETQGDPFASLVANGSIEVPLFLFGGWRSFGEGEWSSEIQARAGVQFEPNDARQSFLRVLLDKANGAPELAPLEGAPVLGGYNELKSFDEGQVILWGSRPDGTTVPLLLQGIDPTCLVFAGYLVPTGGKRFFFSRQCVLLLRWVAMQLTRMHLPEFLPKGSLGRILSDYWAGEDIARSISNLSFSRSLEQHGMKAKFLTLRELSAVSGNWELAAMLSRRVGALEDNEEVRLRRIAEEAMFDSLRSWEEADFDGAVRALRKGAAAWKGIHSLTGLPRGRGFETFFNVLALQAAFVSAAWRDNWADAFPILVAALEVATGIPEGTGHGLMPEIRSLLAKAAHAARDLEATVPPRWWQPLAAFRLLRKLRRMRRELLQELKRAVELIRETHPELSPPAWAWEGFGSQPRRPQQAFEEDQAAGITEQSLLAWIPTHVLGLLLRRVTSLAQPLRNMAIRIAVSPAVALITLIVGFFAPVAGAIMSVLAIIAALLYRRRLAT